MVMFLGIQKMQLKKKKQLSFDFMGSVKGKSNCGAFLFYLCIISLASYFAFLSKSLFLLFHDFYFHLRKTFPEMFHTGFGIFKPGLLKTVCFKTELDNQSLSGDLCVLIFSAVFG